MYVQIASTGALHIAALSAAMQWRTADGPEAVPAISIPDVAALNTATRAIVIHPSSKHETCLDEDSYLKKSAFCINIVCQVDFQM